MRIFIVLSTLLFLSLNLLSVPLTVLSPAQLTSGNFEITAPGLYVLGGDSNFTVTIGSAITITTSDVTLDLNGRVIRGNGTGNTGITILDSAGIAGLENVIVKNGKISGFTNFGIFVGRGSNNVALEGLKLPGTSQSSLVLQGISLQTGPPRHLNFSINNCSSNRSFRGITINDCDGAEVNNCIFSDHNDSGILVNNTINLNLKECLFNANAGDGTTLLSCTSINIKNCEFSNNADSGLNILESNAAAIFGSSINGNKGIGPRGGIRANRSSSIVIDNCILNFNGRGVSLDHSNAVNILNSILNENSLQGILTDNATNVLLANNSTNFNGAAGISTIRDSNNFTILNCKASGNGLASNQAAGLQAAGDEYVVKDCDFSFNQGETSARGATLLGNNNLVENCTFLDNGATTTVFSGSGGIGLRLVLSSNSIIRNCFASGNFSHTSTAAGFLVTDCDNANILENCISNGNTVTSTLFNAYGFLIEEPFLSTSNVTILNCIAEGNKSSNPSLGVGFLVTSDVTNCVIRNSQSLVNTDRGFIIEPSSSFLTGNIAMGNSINYDGSGTFAFVTVTNGTTPASGTFDERKIANIEIA